MSGTAREEGVASHFTRAVTCTCSLGARRRPKSTCLSRQGKNTPPTSTLSCKKGELAKKTKYRRVGHKLTMNRRVYHLGLPANHGGSPQSMECLLKIPVIIAKNFV